jgi:predicted dehydrogenase
VEWLGVCDADESVARQVAEDYQADFFTTDHVELLNRPEVNAVVIATPEGEHARPTLTALDRGLPLLIEKPLATDVKSSAEALRAIEAGGIDVVIGYTQRFRRRFLMAKDRIRRSQLGDVTMVSMTAFLNRLTTMSILSRTRAPAEISPMIVAGTHSLDLGLWWLEGREPVSLYARAVAKALAHKGVSDGIVGICTFDDGSLLNMTVSWAIAESWPASTYGLEVAVIGTEGVLTIDDTHRDVVLGTEVGAPASYTPHNIRKVDYLGSYMPGDEALDMFWGPAREETTLWLQRLQQGMETPHATARDGHRNLEICRALDRSAQLARPVAFDTERGWVPV